MLLVLENRALDSSGAATAKLHAPSLSKVFSPATGATHSETDDHKDYSFVTDGKKLRVILLLL